jgi:hypothetical protein
MARALNLPSPFLQQHAALEAFERDLPRPPCPMIECIPPRDDVEELDEVSRRDWRLVDEVLPLSATVEPPRDRHLRPLEGAVARLVVEQQLDFAVIGALTALGAGEEDVVRLLGPQLVRRERPRRPDHRVGHVRLPEPFGPTTTATRLKRDLDGVRKRLEAAQLDRTEVHALRRLAARTDSGVYAAPVLDDAVVVKVVADETEADIVCGLLRSAGVECGDRDTEAIDSPLEDFTAAGQREILVHQADLETARELPAAEPHPPVAGSGSSERRERLLSRFLLRSLLDAPPRRQLLSPSINAGA